MAAEDVALALMSIDDPEVRRRVAEGDFAALGTLELTDQEQALVNAATPVLPDGHPSKVLIAFDAGEVESHSFSPGENAGYWPAGTAAAIEYVHERLGDPRAQAQFSAWIKSSRDQFP
jgi:hypothetical protein